MQSYDEIAMQSLDFADLNPPFKLSQRIYTIHKNGQTLPLGSGNPRIHIPVLKYIQSNDQPGTKLSSFAVVTNWVPSNKTFSNPT